MSVRIFYHHEGMDYAPMFSCRVKWFKVSVTPIAQNDARTTNLASMGEKKRSKIPTEEQTARPEDKRTLGFPPGTHTLNKKNQRHSHGTGAELYPKHTLNEDFRTESALGVNKGDSRERKPKVKRGGTRGPG